MLLHTIQFQPLHWYKQYLKLFATIIPFLWVSFLVFAASSAPAGAVTPENSKSPLGINLSSVSYWSSEQPFLNIFKTGGGWITQSATTWDTLEESNIPLDDNGYPTRLDGTGANGQPVQYTSLSMLLERQVSPPYYPSGQYIVLYEGEGTLAYKFDATLVSSSPGRDVINVVTPSSAGILIQLKATNPANYLRNVRVVHVTQEASLSNGQYFNPALLSRLASFHTLRYMDWMRTNGSTQSAWANRPLSSKAYFGDSKGVPLEIMAALSNQLQADAWFNMPHMATDDYIGQFATLAHTLLTQNQRVYVEYSNETWNSQFAQTGWLQTQGRAFWPTAQVSAFEFNRNYFGMKTAQMCDIWKSAWGPDAGRVVCVMGGQAANAWTTTSAISCPLWAGAPCNSNHGISAVAIAPYFGYDVPKTFTVDQLFTEMMQGGLVTGGYPGGMVKQAINWINLYAAVAQQNSMELLAYEGGQSLVNNNDAVLTNLYATANKDARMSSAYAAYFQGWKTAGGHGFNHFNDAGDPSKWGMWGALDNIMATSSPKYDALISFNTGNPCWWQDCEEYVPPDLTPPSVPANLTGVVVSATQANLSWNASTDNVGVSGYNVYRNGGQISNTTATTFQDTQFPGSANYNVTAFDAAGNVSAQSTSLSLVTPTPNVTINSPANGVTIRGGNINISVTAANDTTGIKSITIMGDNGTLRICTNVSSCSVAWLRQNLTNGRHTITATAVNGANKQGSTSRTITYRR